MSLFDKFKKNKPIPQTSGYQREKSSYEKPGQTATLQQEAQDVALDPECDDALKKLYDDANVRERMQKELADSSQNEKNSLGQMLGKGVGTLGGSLKKATTGESLLDDRVDQNKPK